MGMAASQARFLNLTARRTNIEYHGQQINQQRTELANESANLYNQMLALQVPVPPNTQDYTRVEYSFQIPGNYDTEAKVTQFAKTTTPGEYTVIFNYTQKEIGFPGCTTKQRSDVSNVTPSSTTSPVYTNEDMIGRCRKNGSNYEFWNGTQFTQLTNQTSVPSTEPLLSVWNKLGCTTTNTLHYNAGANQYYTKEQLETLAAGSPGSESNIQYHSVDDVSAKGGDMSGQFITTYKGKTAELSYVAPNGIHQDAYDELSEGGTKAVWVANVGTEDKPIYQYYVGSEIVTAQGAGEDKHVTYYTASDIDVFHEDSYTPVTISRDGNNRVQSFNYKGEDYAVTANTITDDDAYNDAMNEYTYKSYLYEQEMNHINAQTSIVQAQDRQLELKLKQLDTEHNAVQTEMEAVKAVCKKNVEDSFKTFA
ncbi:hypothetical protein IKE67_02005 [bacterium]|nr:hypothetical protein [bacterium]